MKIVIQKPDLDTCLTALIMNVSSKDNIRVAEGAATRAELLNPKILCIEAGGSGTPALNNFDHHQPGSNLTPACMQAYTHKALNDPVLHRFVVYTSHVDDPGPQQKSFPIPSLSNLFSGLRLVHQAPESGFIKGLEMLKDLVKIKYNPLTDNLPVTETHPYLAVKRLNQESLECDLQNAQYHITNQGHRLGFMETNAIGGIGSLFKQGCIIAALFSPEYGIKKVPKYTIAGRNLKVAGVLEHLNALDPGWGGRDTIVGSPLNGSRLLPHRVLKIILDNL